MSGDDAKLAIEAYLHRLRGRLRGMNDSNVRELVEELRSHIIDKASANGEVTVTGVAAAIAALGSPEDLAGEYMADDLLARAEASRSPVRILESLFAWASLSVAGFVVLMGSILGYFLGIVLILCAVLKPFRSQNTGLWIFPDGVRDFTISLRLGFGNAPTGGRDVLGYWIVPIGLVLGCGIVMLTTRFALWCARRLRRSRILLRD